MPNRVWKPKLVRTSFHHLPRVVYTRFWRTASRRTLTPALGGTNRTNLIIFGVPGTDWWSGSILYPSPRSVTRMLPPPFNRRYSMSRHQSQAGKPDSVIFRESYMPSSCAPSRGERLGSSPGALSALSARLARRILSSNIGGLVQSQACRLPPLWWVINRCCLGEASPNTSTKNSSTGKLISSSAKINYGNGLALHQGELVRRGVVLSSADW
jgi:hypothetical protein